MHPGASVCVIAASGGYPGKYASGKPIQGVNEQTGKDVVVFHSGTAVKDGQLVTAGGRVLAITSMAPDLRAALDLAYAQLAKISFEGMQFRRDIGHRALALEQR
jgi:phosphoribosylamine--glycine ligase